MAKTITINDLRINEMIISPAQQCVIVKYHLVESTGETYGRERVETYWNVLPPPEQRSNQDVQLPAQYMAILVDLYAAALGALRAKYLV